MKRNFKQPDSLELLLDTMCNTFGGIILIALLVALLARDVESRISKSSVGPSEIRLEQLKQDLQTATSYIEKLKTELATATNSEPAALAAQLENARQMRDSLVREIKDREQQLQALNSPEGAVSLARELDSRSQTLETNLHALRAQVDQLRKVLTNNHAEAAALQTQVASATHQRTRSLRMPREHTVTKDPFYFILKFGEIYPVHLKPGQPPARNTTALNWVPKGPDTEAVLPIEGKGLKLPSDKGSIQNLLSGLRAAQFYMVFHVFDDS